MVDHRRFLNQRSEHVLPWFSGRTLSLPDRQVRLEKPPEVPGWYTFAISGRKATLIGPSDAPDVSMLPKVRGVWAMQRLVIDGRHSAKLNFMPGEQPAMFSPVTARRWHSGELLFDSVEFESEVEDSLRQALPKNTGISAIKGVTPALRSAFALLLTERVGRRLQIRFVPAEMQKHLVAIGESGEPAAETALRELEAERAQALREMAELGRRRAAQQLAQEVQLARETQRLHAAEHVNERAEAALEKAGAFLESIRQLGAQQLEVVFEFMDTRFISVVDAATLRVLDSGICLGHPPADELVTLESLPSVIKEAIEEDTLVILRHP